VRILQAIADPEIAAAKVLFQEYAGSLGVTLCFQGFASELAGLPGAYAPPRGRLLLAWSEKGPAGCVAFRPVSEAVCEMKRLFVRPAFRGQGLGRMLTDRVIAEARALAYTSIRLDTLPSMRQAIQLYESLGFTDRPPYYDTPLQGTVFMELKL
jgi:putative acetyltransferase